MKIIRVCTVSMIMFIKGMILDLQEKNELVLFSFSASEWADFC